MKRKCKYYSMNIVESECHCLCICPLYPDLRTKYQFPTSFNTITTFSKLMSSKYVKKSIRNVSKFVYFAMLRRTDTTNKVASNWLYSVYMFVYLIILATIHFVAVNIMAKTVYICWYANKLFNVLVVTFVKRW